MENIETAAVATEEQSADQYDAFMAGFGEDDAPETEQAADPQTEQVEETEQTENSETPENEGSDEPAESSESGAGETVESEGKADQSQKTEPEAPIVWRTKHMGEEKTFGVKDITPEILQKGLDYDRIRGKYDEARPVMEMFSEFAKNAGMSVTDYVKYIRTEAKKATGMSEAEAKRTVELEEREAVVAAEEAQRKADADNKAARESKVRAELGEFAKAFPTVYERAKTDKSVIPQSVWDDVGRGFSLVAAYARYSVGQAEAATKAAADKADRVAQDQKNASRATGSMRSAGNDRKNVDPFLEGFGS